MVGYQLLCEKDVVYVKEENIQIVIKITAIIVLLENTTIKWGYQQLIIV